MRVKELDCRKSIASNSDKFDINQDQCIIETDKPELEENEIDSDTMDNSRIGSKCSKDEISDQQENKSKKNFPKTFKCDICNKGYTWYSGLSNHKRFVHNKLIEL